MAIGIIISLPFPDEVNIGNNAKIVVAEVIRHGVILGIPYRCCSYTRDLTAAQGGQHRPHENEFAVAEPPLQKKLAKPEAYAGFSKGEGCVVQS